MEQKSTQLPDVDIVFNCYERTYRHVITEDFIGEICSKNAFTFKNRIIIINNVNDRKKVEQLAENLVQKKVINFYFFVDDYIEDTLKKLQMKKKDWGRILHYASWALVMLNVAKSKYIVHWDEFITLKDRHDWVTPCLTHLEQHHNIVVANPMWNHNIEKVKGESYYETEDFFYDYGFTDLVFLVNRFRLLKPFYNYHHIYSSRYPMYYVSPTFESRIDSFLRRYNLSRITYKHAYYRTTDISPELGAGYPHFSSLEKIKKFYYYSRLKAYNMIYDSVHNRYRLKKEVILKFIRKSLLNKTDLKIKINRGIGRIKAMFS